jgi:hypothetical protein
VAREVREAAPVAEAVVRVREERRLRPPFRRAFFFF